MLRSSAETPALVIIMRPGPNSAFQCRENQRFAWSPEEKQVQGIRGFSSAVNSSGNAELQELCRGPRSRRGRRMGSVRRSAGVGAFLGSGTCRRETFFIFLQHGIPWAPTDVLHSYTDTSTAHRSSIRRPSPARAKAKMHNSNLNTSP